MTVTLILMRHAKSDWDDPSLDDHDRVLNGRGREAASRIGRWLAAAGTLPGAALVSSARRTVETWSRVAEELPVRPEPTILPSLYLASAETMLAAIRKVTAPVVIVVGHNPGIGDLAGLLARQAPDHPRFGDYPTAATTVMTFDAWSAAGARRGEVTAFTVPRDL